MWLLLLACDSGGPATGDSSRAPPTGQTGTIETTDPGDEPPVRARFVVVGDSGVRTDIRDGVVDALARVCAQKGCDFGLMAGDLFYTCGVDSVDDPSFDEDFEVPFGSLGMPWHAVLGNHDYRESLDGECEGGEAFDDVRAGYQLSYSATRDTHFEMPAWQWLGEPAPGLSLLALDTHRIMWGIDDQGGGGESSAWTTLGPAFRDQTDRFRVALGHHAYLSNGQHGVVGDYANRPAGDDLSCKDTHRPSTAAGRDAGACLKVFYDDFVCGHADLVISGHDHNLALFMTSELCASPQLISGATAGLRALEGELPVTYQTDQVGGFAWVSVCTASRRLEDVRFYSEHSELLYALSAGADAPGPCE